MSHTLQKWLQGILLLAIIYYSRDLFSAKMIPEIENRTPSTSNLHHNLSKIGYSELENSANLAKSMMRAYKNKWVKFNDVIDEMKHTNQFIMEKLTKIKQSYQKSVEEYKSQLEIMKLEEDKIQKLEEKMYDVSFKFMIYKVIHQHLIYLLD